MLLTIHNLPFHFTYARIKSLLHDKCSLTNIILDKLQPEGKTKKVTVGVADEEDAAVLVRKINGLFLDGEHLHVKDVGKNRTSEQPYHSSQTQNPDVSNQAVMYGGQNPQSNNVFQNQQHIDEDMIRKQLNYLQSNAIVNQQVAPNFDPMAGMYLNVNPNYFMGYNFNAQQLPGLQTTPVVQELSLNFNNSGNPGGFYEPDMQNNRNGSTLRSRDRLGPKINTQVTQSLGKKRSHPSRCDTSNQRNNGNFTVRSQRFFDENEHTVTIANSYDNNPLSTSSQIFGEHCTSNSVEPPSYRNEPLSKRIRGCNSQQFDNQESNKYDPAQHLSGDGDKYFGNNSSRVSRNSTGDEFERKPRHPRNRNKKKQFDPIAYSNSEFENSVQYYGSPEKEQKSSRWNESAAASDSRSKYRRSEVSNTTNAVQNSTVNKPHQKFDTRIPELKYGSGGSLSRADKLRAAQNKDLTNRGQAAAEIAKMLMRYSSTVPGVSESQLLKQLKTCIRSRIDVIAGESLITSKDEVVGLYRNRHPPGKDRRFFDAIAKKVCEEEIDEKDPLMIKAMKMAETSMDGDKAEGSGQTLPETKDNKQVKKTNSKLVVFNDDDIFKLTDLHKQILDEEVVTILKVLSQALEAKNDVEKKIVTEIKNHCFEYIAKFAKTTITDRSENKLSKSLSARLYFTPSEPPQWQLDKYLRSIKVVNAVRPHKKVFYVQFDNWNDFNRVLNGKPVKVGTSVIEFKPWLTMKGTEYRKKKTKRNTYMADLATQQIAYMEKKLNLYPEKDLTEIKVESEATKDAWVVDSECEKEIHKTEEKHTCEGVEGQCNCKDIFEKWLQEKNYNSTENNEGCQKLEMIGNDEMLVLDECKSDGCEDDDIDELDDDEIQPDDLEDY